MIDRITIEKIMDSTNIVDVVSEFVSLRKAGINYKGLCPFHDDKTPSFIVSPQKNICHCFACGKGGNAVNFLMEHEQMSYPEALRWLANKYHIDIKERELTDEERQQQSDRESMFAVNAWASGYFKSVLESDPDGKAVGMAYFRSRGFRDDIIEKFRLGYSLPAQQAMPEEALKSGYKQEFLTRTGLCYRRDNGSLVDRYAGRVIFPWINLSGNVCAFGGRLLDSRTKGVQQKYVNSPESDIFHKDHELYGLYFAKKAIAREDRVYMVEGYTDVISMHQCGIENVVANSGTALSIHQIKVIRRFTQNIVLLYDGDEAGIHAAFRGTDMLLAEGMNIKVLLLPDGDDPDSFAKKHSAEEFRQYIEAHQTDFIQFKSGVLLKGVTDPIKRSEAISNIVKSISVIPNPVTRDTYLHECAHALGMNEKTLVETTNKYIRLQQEEKAKELERARRRQEADTVSGGPESGEKPTPAMPMIPVQVDKNAEVEKLLIENIIRHGEEVILKDLEAEDGTLMSLTVAQYVDYDFSLDSLQFSNALYNRILAEAVEHCNDAGFKAMNYFLHHHDLEISNLAAKMSIGRYQLSQSLEMKESTEKTLQKISHLILDFRKNLLDQHMKDIMEEIKKAGSDIKRAMELMKEMKETQQMRDVLARQLGNDIRV